MFIAKGQKLVFKLESFQIREVLTTKDFVVSFKLFAFFKFCVVSNVVTENLLFLNNFMDYKYFILFYAYNIIV